MHKIVHYWANYIFCWFFKKKIEFLFGVIFYLEPHHKTVKHLKYANNIWPEPLAVTAASGTGNVWKEEFDHVSAAYGCKYHAVNQEKGRLLRQENNPEQTSIQHELPQETQAEGFERQDETTKLRMERCYEKQAVISGKGNIIRYWFSREPKLWHMPQFLFLI